MTTTLKIILLLAGSLWGLACLVFLVALAAAAAKPTPDVKSSRQTKAQMREVEKEAEPVGHAHTVGL